MKSTLRNKCIISPEEGENCSLNFGCDVAISANDTLWGVNTQGQAIRYAGDAHWTNQGGPAFKAITATGSMVAAVSTTGAVYTYTSNNTWHSVSGANLVDVAIKVESL